VGAADAGGWWWWTQAEIAVVRTAAVREADADDGQPTVLNASGYVTARRQATVSSKVTGKVVEVRVEEGMAVREGQILARLDDASERSYLALAEAQLAAARGALEEYDVRHAEATLNLNRMRQLVADGVVGQAELDAAQAEEDSLQARIAYQREQVTVAEREVDVRRTALDDTIIRAPFTGVATRSNRSSPSSNPRRCSRSSRMR
jgi:multidrug efflux pump subunit AcrA (membrane-fusion protein)